MMKKCLVRDLCPASIRGVYEMITDETGHGPIVMAGPQTG